MKSLALVALVTVTLLFGEACQAATQPNIVFIMSDDHAAHAVGAYGGRLASLNPTPTLDRLASEGVRFTNCFCSNSICTPSRATLMTGQYSHTNGITTLEGKLPAERQTLPRAMKTAGYETAIIGKWHLTAEPGAFDYYCVLGSQGQYFNPFFRVRGPKPWTKNVRFPHLERGSYDSIHSSDAVTDESIAWLKRRNDRRPFFLMHHFKAPHDNFENAERYDWLYANETIPEPKNLRQRENHGAIDAPLYGTSVSKRNRRRNMGHHMQTDPKLDNDAYTGETYQRYLKKYLRCVRGVDDNIARLIAHLKQTGELDNTIILYTADQGFMLGEHDYIDKRWIYEESLRMPLIVWAGKNVDSIDLARGKVRDEFVGNVDFLPTLVDLAGAQKMPAGIQGQSITPLLTDQPAPADWKDAVYYRYWMHMTHHDNPAHYGIRTKNYKLVFFYGLPLDAPGALPTPTPPHWELYDLNTDPEENDNVINYPRYAEIAASLKERLLDLKAETGDTDEKYPELMKVRDAAW